MSARLLRLHFPDGSVVVEPLTRTARANDLNGVPEARQLIDAWLERDYVRRRPDGGLDVLKLRPRPDTATIRAMRATPDLEAAP